MTRRAVRPLLAAAVAVAVAGWLLTRPAPDPVWTLPADAVARLEVENHTLDEWRPPMVVTDPAVIAAVLAAVRPVSDAPHHKCATQARLVVTERSGRQHRLDALAGHDPQFYEWRDDRRWVRVDRPAFLVAMRRAGVDWLPATD